MNLGALIDNFRNDERDTGTPPLFASADLARFYSEAEEEASIRKSLIRKDVIIPLLPGDFEVTLPSGVIEVRTARIVEGSEIYWLDHSDRYEQDRLNRNWRDTTGRPTAFIHDDKSVTLNRVVESVADLKMECYRTPSSPLVDDSDEPEIASIHHRKLDGWVRYRVYSIPDNERTDMNKAASGLAEFEAYFGKRPDANHRRNNNANRPHRVKAW